MGDCLGGTTTAAARSDLITTLSAAVQGLPRTPVYFEIEIPTRTKEQR